MLELKCLFGGFYFSIYLFFGWLLDFCLFVFVFVLFVLWSGLDGGGIFSPSTTYYSGFVNVPQPMAYTGGVK